MNVPFVQEIKIVRACAMISGMTSGSAVPPLPNMSGFGKKGNSTAVYHRLKGSRKTRARM
jgi:hypothetical protein